MTVIRLNIVSRVRFKKRLIRGTKRGKGHGWYTGGASAVRNGIMDTVGTREGNLRYGTGWRARLVHGKGFRGTERDGGTRLVHGRGFCGTERGEGHGWYTGGASEVRNGMEGHGCNMQHADGCFFAKLIPWFIHWRDSSSDVLF